MSVVATDSMKCNVCGGPTTEQHVRDNVYIKCTRKQLYGVCEAGMGALSLAPLSVCQAYTLVNDRMCSLLEGHKGQHYDENTSVGYKFWGEDPMTLTQLHDTSMKGNVVPPLEVLGLLNKIEEIRSQHNDLGLRWVGFPRADHQEKYCQGCNEAAPCTTVRTLS